jgi:hypothetical protein
LDLYFPVMQGLDVRIGRFISIPDIEAQLAPNNYTYVHSLTYTYDNFTNNVRRDRVRESRDQVDRAGKRRYVGIRGRSGKSPPCGD